MIKLKVTLLEYSIDVESTLGYRTSIDNVEPVPVQEAIRSVNETLDNLKLRKLPRKHLFKLLIKTMDRRSSMIIDGEAVSDLLKLLDERFTLKINIHKLKEEWSSIFYTKVRSMNRVAASGAHQTLSVNASRNLMAEIMKRFRSFRRYSNEDARRCLKRCGRTKKGRVSCEEFNEAMENYISHAL